jgi:amidase
LAAQSGSALRSNPVAANGEEWDVASSEPGFVDSGAILSGGRSYPFNGFGYLRLTVEASGLKPLVENQILRGFGLVPDGRQGLHSTRPVTYGGVLVERTLWAPSGTNYLRFFDTFTNFTGETKQIHVAWGGGVGWGSTQGWSTTIGRTSSGDRRLDLSDSYVLVVATDRATTQPLAGPSRRGPVALVFGSPNAGVLEGFGGGDRDPFHASYRSGIFLSCLFHLTLAPGQSVSLVTFAIKGSAELRPRARDAPAPPTGSEIAKVLGTADSLSRAPDLAGLSRTELRQIVNWRTETGGGNRRPFGIPVVETGIAELQRAMSEGRSSAEQLTKQYLARIAAYDAAGPRFNAMIFVNPHALDEARALDQERERGSVRGPLHGVATIVKDNYDTRDMPTSVGSLAFAGFTPPRDATLVSKLRAAGVVLLGKANLDEFGWGNTTTSGVSGRTGNAYDPERNAGGSSGGGAVATAASLATFALGTDACNSLSFPAALASLVTLRSSAGLTSRAGIAPGIPLQDAGGPLTRSVRDLALVLDAIAGSDPADSATTRASERIPASYVPVLREGALRGARLGVLRQVFQSDTVEPGVDSVITRAFADMRRAGATIVEVTLASLERLQSESGGFSVRGAFGSALERYLADRPELPYRSIAELAASGKLLRRNFGFLTRTGTRSDGTVGPLGFGAPALDREAYARVVAGRERYRRALEGLMDSLRLDALLYPANLSHSDLSESLSSLFADGTCKPSAQTGLPQLTVPAGWIAGRYAVGLQFLGRLFDESRLLALGYDYERLTRHRRPPRIAP